MVIYIREFFVKLIGNICLWEENFMVKYFEMLNFYFMLSFLLFEKDRLFLKDCIFRIIVLILFFGFYFVVINNVLLNFNKIKL